MGRTKKYKVVSLFSGAMGLDIGMDQTDQFELLACVEIEKSFCDTIRANKAAGRLPATLSIIEADIAQLSVEQFLERTGIDPEEIDVIVGGPPCQAFSTAGRRKSVEDPRGTLLWDYLRFIQELKPKVFLIENVRGILSAALKHRPIAQRPNKGGPELEPDEIPGSVVSALVKDLQAIPDTSYHMDCYEVNAVNYGAPQLRERALFIGNRFGEIIDFPEPTHGILHDEPSQDLFERQPLKPWRTLRDALHGLNGHGEVLMDFSPRKKGFLEMVPEGSNWRSLPEEVQKESMGRAWHAKGGRSGWWRRLTMDLPCPTLVTMPNHASTSLCHPIETRALSLREYARIQEFPDDWEFCGTASKQYAQVGNAVPIRLGRIAGEAIANALDNLAQQNWVISATAPDAFRKVYLQAHVRTRQWYKAGETVIWETGKGNISAQYGAPKTTRKTKKLGGNISA